MQYRTLLFDFDGTLVPSLDLWLDAYRDALYQFGVTLPDVAIITTCIGRSYESAAADVGIASASAFRAHVETALAQSYAATALFPEVVSLLAFCREAGVTLGLVTSSVRSNVEPALSRLGILAYFGTVVTGDEVMHHKPHPQPVLLALSRLGRTPDSTLLVGDSLADVRAGHAASTHVALFMPEAHARFHDFAALRNEQPEYTFAEYETLHVYLANDRIHNVRVEAENSQ